MRTCGKCETPKPVTSFAKTGDCDKDGVPYRRRICSACQSRRSKETGGEAYKARRSKALKRSRQENRAMFIVRDCRAVDRKKELGPNDLDVEFVRSLIADGCCYCGDSSIRMTLDRIDNSVAHLRANVKPACIRCNYVRGSMPHRAWLVVATAMRKAREEGLFGEWRNGPVANWGGLTDGVTV